MPRKTAAANVQADGDQQTEPQQQEPIGLTHPALTPDVVEEIGSPAVETAELEIPKGHVLLVGLDADGNEVGEPFTVSEAGYHKAYRNEKKFLLKKKAQ